jgi:hypothetical protein
MDWSIK